MPHSEIPGSTPACGSPGLIAACHVLHRLLAPRHSPQALSSLIAKSGPLGGPVTRTSARGTQRTVSALMITMRSFQRTHRSVLARVRDSQGPGGGKGTGPKSALSVVGVTGLEPVTLRLSSACSNQLSYTPVGAGRAAGPGLVELRRFELPTYSLQSCRSTN